MPRTARTPPPATETEDQDVMCTPDNMYIHTDSRSKRLRPNFSPDNQWQIFESRILKKLDLWKSEQDTILNKLTKDIAEVQQQNRDIQKTNNEIEKALEFMNSGYETMRQTVETLERERLDQRNYILELEKTVRDLHQSSRNAAIEIRNVPQNEKETVSDLTSLVVQTCNAIEVPIKTSELRDVYRLPGNKGTNRPIVAEFVSVLQKGQVLHAARTFNKGLPRSEKLNTGHIGLCGPTSPS